MIFKIRSIQLLLLGFILSLFLLQRFRHPSGTRWER